MKDDTLEDEERYRSEAEKQDFRRMSEKGQGRWLEFNMGTGKGGELCEMWFVLVKVKWSDMVFGNRELMLMLIDWFDSKCRGLVCWWEVLLRLVFWD